MAQAAANKDLPSAVEVSIELHNAASSINELVAFIRATTTADMKIRPNQAVGATFVIQDEQTATAAQTDVLFSGGLTVNPTTATVSYFIDGVAQAPSTFSIQANKIVVPALSGGESILLEIHENAESVFADLASIAANLGASLIGLEDIEGVYASSNVESALYEVRAALNAFIALIGDVSKYLKADVAIPLEIDQDANGYSWTGMRAGVVNGEPIVFEQFQEVLTFVQTLGNRFLPLAGGAMTGPINMQSQAVLNLPIPVADASPVRKKEFDELAASATESFIPYEGRKSADYAALANVRGPLAFYKGDGGDPEVFSPQAASDEADAAQDSAASISTWNGVPKPVNTDQATNKLYVDEADALLQQRIDALDSGAVVPAGGYALGDTTGGLDISNGGEYHTEGDTTITSAMTPTNDVFVRVLAGSLTVTGTITTSAHVFIDVDGDVVVNAALACDDLTIRATGSITVAAAVTCGDLDMSAATDLVVSSPISATNIRGAALASATISTTLTAIALAGAFTTVGGTATNGASADGRYGGGAGVSPGLYLTSGAGGGTGGSAGGAVSGGAGGVGAGGFAAAAVSRGYLLESYGGGSGASAVAITSSGTVAIGGSGGGTITLFVEGDLDLSSGTLNASGTNGDTGTALTSSCGGGGGGVVKASCTGTMTNGTLSANGAVGVRNSAGVAGGGGGGGAFAVAAVYAGSQTLSANGGAGANGGGAGGAGSSAVEVFTSTKISEMRGLLTQ